MNMMPWTEVALGPSADLASTLVVLDRTALQIVVVVDTDGVLLGTVTDGDIRRALLRGCDLTDPVSAHMNKSPSTVKEGTDTLEALGILRRLVIRCLPVLDARGRVVDLIFLEDLHRLSRRDTPVLVMAGGRGERLRPLTDVLPKPLVPVAGEPLIDIPLRRLSAQGFQDIWVALHYKAVEIMTHLGSGEHYGVNIRYVYEERPLGTAGAVLLVEPAGESDPILVCNADTVHAADYGALVDHHQATAAVATMAVYGHQVEIPYGVVQAVDGFVASLVEKPVRTELVSAGINVVSRGLVAAAASDDGHVDIPEVIETALRAGSPVAVHEVRGYWLDVGTAGRLAKANSDHTSR